MPYNEQPKRLPEAKIKVALQTNKVGPSYLKRLSPGWDNNVQGSLVFGLHSIDMSKGKPALFPS